MSLYELDTISLNKLQKVMSHIRYCIKYTEHALTILLTLRLCCGFDLSFLPLQLII